MIIKHKTQRRYQYGGSGIFDIVGKLASKIAAKTPEMIAKAQANDSIDKVTKEVVKQGEKALIDNSGKLAKATVRTIVDTINRKKPPTDVIAKQMATDLMNSLPPKKNSYKLNKSKFFDIRNGLKTTFSGERYYTGLGQASGVAFYYLLQVIKIYWLTGMLVEHLEFPVPSKMVDCYYILLLGSARQSPCYI